MKTIEEFVSELSEIPEREFTHENVLEFLRRNPVSLDELSPFLYFCQEHYTRNLIKRTSLFDLLAIGWESGQQSPIHNHANQRCWMAMACGRVRVQNFEVLKQDAASGYCELRASTHYILDSGNPQEVDPEEPIHLVANPHSFGGRAVTLHIYSKPYDTCEVYDLKAKQYHEVPLSNSTEYGRITCDWKLEKADWRALAIA